MEQQHNMQFFPMNPGSMPHFGMTAEGNFNIKTEPQFEIKTEPQDMFQSVTSTTKTTPAKSKKRKQDKVKQEKITDHMPVKKKKHDRFKGMPEEEVMKRLLPDHLAEDLDIVIVGINPGLMAAYIGHHYAGPGNHFWKCMYLSGLIPEPLTAYDDNRLLKYGIGFTNIVARTTRGSADLTRKEIKEGAKQLTEKLNKYKPKIAVFNGKGIYEVFLGHKNFAIGKQPEPLEGTNTVVYVMPSSSARCSQLPRAVDKVPFYAALKKLRDHLRGDLKELDDSEVCFPDLELKVIKKEDRIKSEGYPDTDNKLNNSNIPAPYTNNQPMNGAVGPPGVNHSGNFTIKQEVPYRPQEYGTGGGMSGINVPCPSFPISSAAFSGRVDSHPLLSQGMLPMPATTYPSQTPMFGLPTSQMSHFPSSQGNYIPSINCPSIPSQDQGHCQFVATGNSNQGHGQTDMFTQGQIPSQSLPPQSLQQYSNSSSQGNFQSSSGPLQASSSIAIHGWPDMQNPACRQSHQQPQQGFDQMQNPVFIKAEPQEFGSSSTCPFQNA